MTEIAAPAPPYPIRTATPDTLRAFLAPLTPAFGEPYTDEEYEGDRHVFEQDADRVIGAFDGDEVVASAGAFTFRLTVPGGEVGAAGVSLVAVKPSHRRRGILSSLMRHQLDDVRRRGEPVAILWASEGAIYQRFGYGLAVPLSMVDVERGKAALLRPEPPRGRVRLVTPEVGLAAIPPIYETHRAATPGAVSRSEAAWQWLHLRDAEHMRRGNGPKFLAVLEVDGRPEAYAIYRHKSEWDERGPKGELLVQEAIATNARAERDLWAWLLDIDLIGRVRSVRASVPHPLFLLLAEPRRLGMVVSDGLWLRLVDLPAALEARSYAATGTLVIDVRDRFCPSNDGRWRVEVADRVRVSRSEAEPDLALDTADLAALYLGGVQARDLVRAGRIEERRPGAARQADALFAAERAPWCATMF